jgi:hypothetical protein
MKRNGIRRLALNKETLRRLAADDLSRVAGGRGTCCTYGYSGCAGVPTVECWTAGCDDYTGQCDSNCCL